MLKRKKLIDLTILLLIGLLSVTWFRGNFLINHGDQGYPLSPLEDFKNSLYFWNHLWATGFARTAGLANLFFYLFPLLTIFKIPLAITEKLLYYFIFTFAGVFIYLLVDSLKVKNSRLTGITVALAYISNFRANIIGRRPLSFT